MFNYILFLKYCPIVLSHKVLLKAITNCRRKKGLGIYFGWFLQCVRNETVCPHQICGMILLQLNKRRMKLCAIAEYARWCTVNLWTDFHCGYSPKTWIQSEFLHQIRLKETTLSPIWGSRLCVSTLNYLKFEYLNKSESRLQIF